MIKTVYEVSLFPIEKGLQSPFEISSENDDLLDIGEYKEAVTQQESAHCSQSKAHDESPEITDTITLVTRNRGHAQVSLVGAYSNGRKNGQNLFSQ